MEGASASPIFILSHEDVGSTSYSYTLEAREGHSYADVFHQNLPSGSLLETDDVIQQFLSSNEPLEEPDLGPTTLHCEICQKKFDNAKKYYGHLRVHSKSNAWVCDKCPDQKFSTKQQLMKHSLTHKPLEKIWKCPQCPMIFEVLFKLQQHLFSKHLNYRPHKCNHCEKKFNKLSDLKKHQNIHSKVKPFECRFCRQKFSDKSNMERHILKHTNERPYCCTGCGNKYQQVASLKRHQQRCTASLKQPIVLPTGPSRLNYCRTCGMAFQYKSALVEHCASKHTNSGASTSTDKPTATTKQPSTTKPAATTKETKLLDDSLQNNADSKAVDNIVDDILSVEADYSITNRQNTNKMLNIAIFDKNLEQTESERNAENMMHIEFLKEMNQLHNLDDELFYNDLDFDSLNTGQGFNTNEGDENQERNGEILFDFPDGTRSMDQEIMNALYQVKTDQLPDDLLSVADEEIVNENHNLLSKHVPINECATIFETDVDLDASTSLAANLNQLIGDNNVKYVATEHDDTFIITLNSTLDANRLTDMLSSYAHSETPEATHTEIRPENMYVYQKNTDAIILEIPETLLPVDRSCVKEKKPKKQKLRKQVLFVCRECCKVFKKKENYRSHLATHDPSLRRHKCDICKQRFSYRATLNKHVNSAHRPRVQTAHSCQLCDKVYTAAWMLKAHREREHERLTPYACDRENCTKKFYKKNDLVVHKRSHLGERPFSCKVCLKTFTNLSHMWRHLRNSRCKNAKKRKTKNTSDTTTAR